MKLSYLKTALLGTLLLPLLAGCDEFESADTVDGLWVCREVSTNGVNRVYNIDVERGSISDTSQFVVYNLFNLGYEFGVNVSLFDSLFSVTSTTNVVYSVSGTGVLTPKPDNYKIEWNCSISGPGINESHVSIISTKK